MSEISQADFLRMMEAAGYDASLPHPHAYAGFSWTLLLKEIIARSKRPDDVHDFGDALDPNASHNRRPARINRRA